MLITRLEHQSNKIVKSDCLRVLVVLIKIANFDSKKGLFSATVLKNGERLQPRFGLDGLS